MGYNFKHYLDCCPTCGNPRTVRDYNHWDDNEIEIIKAEREFQSYGYIKRAYRKLEGRTFSQVRAMANRITRNERLQADTPR